MCPRTLELARSVVKISLTPTMTEEQVEQVAEGVEKVLAHYLG